jgi:hypothetical protein
MLTPATKKVLQMISEVLHFAQVTQVDPDKPLYLLMLATDHTPTTLLWQEHGPLEMATSASGFCVLMPYYIRVSALIIKGCTHVWQLFGMELDVIVVPLTKSQLF